jgi:hypothetical protein
MTTSTLGASSKLEIPSPSKFAGKILSFEHCLRIVEFLTEIDFHYCQLPSPKFLTNLNKMKILR